MVIPRLFIEVKSDCAPSPGLCTCSKITSRSGPCCAFHRAIRLCSVLSWVGMYLPGCLSHSSSNNVVACSAGSLSSWL